MINKKNSRENQVIVQHNYLIEARYNLSLQEKRLMYWLASKSKADDENFKEHELPIKEFAKLVDVKGDHLYKELKLITHKLMDKIITIQSLTDRSFSKVHMLSGAKYDDKSGIIKLSFHPYLKPYMLQLQDRFTKINLGDILGLRSVHAIRIYEILKQYEFIGTREAALNELRECCGIETGQYKKFNDFKKDVLERAKREINEKTDIFISYEEVKIARKVTSIRFSIKKNPEYKKTVFEKSQQEKAAIIQKELRSGLALVEKLMEYGFTRQTAKKLVQQGTEQEIGDAIKSVDLQVMRVHVKNAKAMLRIAVKERWKPDVFVSRKKQR
jgi:plasmid replication initiation protein